MHYVKCWAGWIINWNQDCQEKYQQPQTVQYQISNYDIISVTHCFYTQGLVLIPGSSLQHAVILSVNSVAQLYLTVCDPMDCSTPGLPVHHQLPKLVQTHVHWVSNPNPTILSSVVPFSSCLQSFPGSVSFPIGQLFASGGQSFRVSALASTFQWIFRTDFL